MSEQKNGAWPFSPMESTEGLDIDAIFGAGSGGGDVNPFDVPAAEAGTQPVPAAEPVQADMPAASDSRPEPEGAPDGIPGNQEEVAEPTQMGSQQSPAPKPENDAQEKEKVSEVPSGEDNPIAAAFAQKDDENTRQGLLERPPVFAYGSAKEAIMDSGMTFEELRIKKADDFPELAEGKRVSWTVEYGKTVKSITDPKGVTIQSVKTEIELSKEFLDGLKKARNKTPECLVKPKVTAQSKGIAAYKGLFTSMEEARASDKAICILPGRDGRVYELRRNALGEFIAPKDNVVDFQQIRAGFTPALPRIPWTLLCQIIAFFRSYMREGEEFEALAHILWDKADEKFVVRIPEQEVCKDGVSADLRRDPLPEDRYLHYADIHSHNSMAAKFSSVDDRDEQATRLYIVLGRLDQFFPRIAVRISCGGVFQPVDPAAVLEGFDSVFPSQWRNHVKPRRRSASPAQAVPYWTPGPSGRITR